jgi:hypothetical protein
MEKIRLKITNRSGIIKKKDGFKSLRTLGGGAKDPRGE